MIENENRGIFYENLDANFDNNCTDYINNNTTNTDTNTNTTDVDINTEYNTIFEDNVSLVYYFVKKYPQSFMEQDEYTTLLLEKFWELIQRFKYDKYNNLFERNRAFCSYVMKSLTNYRNSLIEKYYKEKAKRESNHCYSLDEPQFIDEDELYLDTISQINIPEKRYYVQKLQELKINNSIKGYLLDKINGYSYTDLTKKYKCSKSTVHRNIEREIEILKKAVGEWGE